MCILLVYLFGDCSFVIYSFIYSVFIWWLFLCILLVYLVSDSICSVAELKFQCIRQATLYCDDGSVNAIYDIFYAVQDAVEIQCVNYCERVPCDNGGQCITNKNNYKCLCLDGYSGPTCQRELIDIIVTPFSHLCVLNVQLKTITCHNDTLLHLRLIKFWWYPGSVMVMIFSPPAWVVRESTINNE